MRVRRDSVFFFFCIHSTLINVVVMVVFSLYLLVCGSVSLSLFIQLIMYLPRTLFERTTSNWARIQIVIKHLCVTYTHFVVNAQKFLLCILFWFYKKNAICIMIMRFVDLDWNLWRFYLLLLLSLFNFWFSFRSFLASVFFFFVRFIHLSNDFWA